MLATFFQPQIKKINFEIVQHALNNSEKYMLINTLTFGEQYCLIKNTIFYQDEERVINGLLNAYDYESKTFIIYGKNANDETAEKKAKQIMGFGFQNVFLYSGGLFEWMLLQDIYGDSNFPTTKHVLDILKFK